MKLRWVIVLLISMVLVQAKELFNGKDLKGWVPMHSGEWTIEDGILVGAVSTSRCG